MGSIRMNAAFRAACFEGFFAQLQYDKLSSASSCAYCLLENMPAQHSCTNLLACHFRMAARSPNRFDGAVAAARHLEIRRDPVRLA